MTLVGGTHGPQSHQDLYFFLRHCWKQTVCSPLPQQPMDGVEKCPCVMSLGAVPPVWDGSGGRASVMLKETAAAVGF